MLKSLRKRSQEAPAAESPKQDEAKQAEASPAPAPSPKPSSEGPKQAVHQRIDRVARFANGDNGNGHGAQDHDKVQDHGHEDADQVSEPSEPVAMDDDQVHETRPEEQVLTVGRGIRLSAEMCECDTLFVEGELKAKAQCNILRVAKGGTFNGQAQVEYAEIAGSFQGHLLVSKRLTIRDSGICDGEVRYGEILIDAGGRIAGALSWREEDEESAPEQVETTDSAPSGQALVVSEPVEQAPEPTVEECEPEATAQQESDRDRQRNAERDIRARENLPMAIAEDL